MTAVIRVLLVDDHPVVREGLRSFLDAMDDIEVVAEADDGAEAVRLAQRFPCDVVLLDLKMPGMDGRQALLRLTALPRPPVVLVLTSVADSKEVPAAMEAGAAGFLYKDVAPAALAQAIRSVKDGQVLLAPGAAAAMVRPPDPARLSRLTARERQVLVALARGRSNREISRQLDVTEKTVKTHVSSLLRKLEVADRTQAALLAVRHEVV